MAEYGGAPSWLARTRRARRCGVVAASWRAMRRGVRLVISLLVRAAP
jgi:hypothetical protein